MITRVSALIGAAALAGGTFAGGATSALARGSAAHVAAAPSMAQITARMKHTIEIGTRGEYFKPVGKPLTVKDGRGTGTITAAIGVRWPTADAKGQIVFFWHNSSFNSMSADYETPAVIKLAAPAAGTFAITYAHYKASDPLCCPSLKPVVVNYGWGSDNMLISDGVPPHA